MHLVAQTLVERIERWREMRRLHFDQGLSYAAIGRMFPMVDEDGSKKALPKQRVSRIVNGPEPRDPGRPSDTQGGTATA